MNDAIANLKKAKLMYNQRCLEYEKAKVSEEERKWGGERVRRERERERERERARAVELVSTEMDIALRCAKSG